MMKKKNYLHLDLSGMLGREILKVVDGKLVRNPEEEERHDRQWTAIALVELELYLNNNLLLKPEQFKGKDIKEVEIWYDDFTDWGKEFLHSGQIGKWLDALDRQNMKDKTIMASLEKLQKRYDKFKKQQLN